jgi:CubicO group peptidase (beta-lactamase class C family)
MIMNRTFVMILTLIFSGCYVTDNIPPDPSPWPYDLPSDHGINDNALLLTHSAIKGFQYENIKSMTILHEDAVIFEHDYDQQRRSLRRIEDLTNLFANLALGIAIDEGLVGSVEDSIHLYLPEYAATFEAEPLKKGIKLAHLLMHRAGFSWNESIVSPYSPDNNLNQMRSSSDWAGFILSQPLEAIPGLRHNYNSGAVQIISKIITNVSGESMEQFLVERLFKPLGITNWTWDTGPGQITDAAGGLSLSQLDVVKIGYLFLNEGSWEGQQIVSRNWVLQSTQVQSLVSNNYHFGYTWWKFDETFLSELLTEDIYCYPGGFGNHLYVVPSKDLVVSIGAQNIESGLYNDSFYLFLEIQNIIP